MMYLVFISRGWWPNVRGGSERLIYRVSHELFNRGYEVVGIYYRFPNNDDAEASFKLLSVCSGNYNYLKAISFSYRAASKALELKPDVVIINGYWSEVAPIFIKRRLKVIYLIHDLGFIESRGALVAIKKLLMKYSIRYSNIIIVPTDVVKRNLVNELSISEDVIRVIGFEGIDAPLKRVFIDNEYFDIVQIGRYSPNKGHLILLNAFREVIKELSNARLWLVGGSDPKSSDYLIRVKELARSINEEVGKEVVRVVVNAQDISQYYELADVCVAPSLGAEGFGISVAECMGYGKPVIVSDVFKETGVVDEESAYIVPRGDHRELAKAILEIVNNRELASRLSKNALSKASRYDWSRVTDFIEGTIKELIN